MVTLLSTRELASDGIVHKPCGFNPNGVSERTCHDTSRVPRHNVRCQEVQCRSPLRACVACMKQGGDIKNVSNPRSGLCAFHEKHGSDARPKKDDLLAHIERHRHKDMPGARALPSYTPLEGDTPSLSVVATSPEPPDPFVAEEGVFYEPEPLVQRTPESIAALTRARQAVARAVPVEVDPTLIRRMPNQPRKHFDAAEITALAQGIVQDGQLQRGLIRPIPEDADGHRYELIDGERRWLAVLEGKVPLYRANLAEMDDQAAAYLISVALNFNRVQHTPLEIAEAIEYMNDTLGMTYKEISATTGYHPVELSKFRSLLRLVPQVRAMLDPSLPKNKRLPTTVAMNISLYKPALQLETAQKYFARELSSGMINRLAQDVRYRSTAVLTGSAPDIYAQWRTLAKRAVSVRGMLEELRELVKITRQPESDDPLIGRTHTAQEMRQVKDIADEILALLKHV